MFQSIATIDAPEFINLQPSDINPLMSACEIKVMYTGGNRNRTLLTKEKTAEIAKTLRGAPIVGYYKDTKQDFADHGQKVVFDDEGVHFQCMTVPYGFVSPNARVWFQKFEDIDELGNATLREYLMTEGYIWDGQYPEAKVAIEEGRPHSMEFDKKSYNGHWSKDYNSNMEFFIINDAIFSKLCILGEDVEPCFEGSSVTAPKVSANFTLDDNFKQTLYTMMQDLKTALEGGQRSMNDEMNVQTSAIDENSVTVDNSDLENQTENDVNTEANVTSEEVPAVVEEPAAVVVEETPVVETEFVVAKDKEEDDDKDKEDEENDKDSSNSEEDEDKKKDKEKYEFLENQFNDLQKRFSAMEEEYNSLKAFKAEIEDKEKDALINRFYMLDDEDKKDIIANKANYSLDDIEAKLSIIYTKKNLAAETAEQTQVETAEVFTYTLNDTASNLPDWVKAVQAIEAENN